MYGTSKNLQSSSEHQWTKFYENVCTDKKSSLDTDRYVRMNVELEKELPRLDDYAKLSDLQAKAQVILRGATYQAMLEDIAHRLVASSFFFQATGRATYDHRAQSWSCPGMFQCQRIQRR